jgi:hypothetical protein
LGSGSSVRVGVHQIAMGEGSSKPF